MLQFIYDWALAHGFKIVLIIFAAAIISRVGRGLIEKAIRKAVKNIAQGLEKQREDTLAGIFNGVLKVFLWLIALMMILPEFGIAIGPVLAGAGVIGVALGFGAQWMVRDFLAGLAIILENQFRVGDVVCLDNTCGYVEEITLRKTVMRDLEGKVYHVPNGTFQVVANFTKDFSRAYMKINVSYKEDLAKAMEVIDAVGKELAAEPAWKGDIIKPIQVLGPGPSDFGSSGIELQILGETKPMKQWNLLKEFRRRLKIAFDKEGIEILLPQIVIHQAKS